MRAVYVLLSFLSAMAAVVSDVLQPLLPFAALVASVLGILFVLILGAEKVGLVRTIVLAPIPARVINFWNEHLGPEELPDVRNMVLMAALLFASGAAFSQASAGEGGYVQKVIPALQPLAAKMDQMAIDLKGVNEVVVDNNERLARIEHGLQGVARETSDDPQKEIANLGLDFHPMFFFKNIGNDRIFDLFMQAGISVEPSEWSYFFGWQDAFSETELEHVAQFIESRNYGCPFPLDVYSEHAASEVSRFMWQVTQGGSYGARSSRRKVADMICDPESLESFVESYSREHPSDKSLRDSWVKYNNV